MPWMRQTNENGQGVDAEHREPTLGSVAPQPTEHIGMLMRECREHFGEDLRTVAQALRIRQTYLQAIEQGHFEALPGATYAVGFVRAYSDYLGLDTKVILQRFRAETSNISSRSDLDFPVAPPEGRFPNAATLAASLVLVVAAAVGWQYFSNENGATSIVAAVVPADETQAPIAEPGGARVAEAVDAVQPATAELADAIVPPPPGDDEADAAPVRVAEALPLPADAFAGRVEVMDRDDLRAAINGRRPVNVPIASPLDAPPPVARTTPVVAAAPLPPVEVEPVEAVEAEPAPRGAGEPATVPYDGSPAALADAASPREAAPGPNSRTAAIAPDGAPAPDDEQPQLALVEPDAGEQPAPGDLPEAALPLPPTRTALLSDGVVADEPRGRIYGMPNRDARIIIGADTDSWVQIRDESQADIFTRLLRAGDQYRVPNREGLTLLTGNAGGLRLTIDGKAAPPIGEIGEVARDVPLVPDRLKAGATALN